MRGFGGRGRDIDRWRTKDDECYDATHLLNEIQLRSDLDVVQALLVLGFQITKYDLLREVGVPISSLCRGNERRRSGLERSALGLPPLLFLSPPSKDSRELRMSMTFLKLVQKYQLTDILCELREKRWELEVKNGFGSRGEEGEGS